MRRWVASGQLGQASAADDLGVRKVFAASLEAPAASDPPRTVRFRVTTGDVDRERDVISPAGWELGDFLRSPSILFAHDYSQPPVGRAISLERDDRGISALIEFAPPETYAFADTIYRLVRGGYLNATSVGFQPLDWVYNEDRRGVDFKRQALLEISVVPVPANQNALVEARAAGIDVEPVRRWATGLLLKWLDQPTELPTRSKAGDPAQPPATPAPACSGCGHAKASHAGGPETPNPCTVAGCSCPDHAPPKAAAPAGSAPPCAACGHAKASHEGGGAGPCTVPGCACQDYAPPARTAAPAAPACANCGHAKASHENNGTGHCTEPGCQCPNFAPARALRKGVTPGNPSGAGKADEATAWSAPTLSDFTAESWDDLSDPEKRKIARHYAWAAAMPPATFGDCKLPHHRASDAATVWNGVRAAMSVLMGGRGGVNVPPADRRAIYDHLAAHYRDFSKDPPEFHAARNGRRRADRKMTDAPASVADVIVDLADLAADVAEVAPLLAEGSEASLHEALGIVTEIDDDVDDIREDLLELLDAGGDGDGAGGGMTPSPYALAGRAGALALKAAADAADPPRWNRQLSRAFDVAAARTEPATAVYAWVSQYIGADVKDLHRGGAAVPSARMGAFLLALDQTLDGWTVDAVRNLRDGGAEAPPQYETIRLNSARSGDFLVEGLRFMRRADGARAVLGVGRSWWGLDVDTYVPLAQREVTAELLRLVRERAASLGLLRGEALSLGGEFLERTGEGWSDLFLEPAVLAPLKRASRLLAERGAALEPRGVLLMGPPGTGKTLAGRVLMNETAGATFLWVAARDFYRAGAFGGLSYAFELAEECAPTVLFIEDVDAWLDSYSVDLLKTEMDGVRRRSGVVTVLTTNFPHRIPEALIDRPGRFHDVLELGLPGPAVRLAMLEAWLPDLDAPARARAAAETGGFSGAHLRELVRFARIVRDEQGLELGEAVRRALAKVRDQRELIDRVRNGARAYAPSRAARLAVEAGAVRKVEAGAELVRRQSRVVEATVVEDVGLEAIPYEADVLAGLSADDVRAALREALVIETVTGLRRVISRAQGRVD